MMIGANIPKEVQFMVYRDTFDTACKLDGLIPITIDRKMKSKYGKCPNFANYL